MHALRVQYVYESPVTHLLQCTRLYGKALKLGHSVMPRAHVKRQ